MSDIFNKAIEHLTSDKDAILPLPIRKQIWIELGGVIDPKIELNEGVKRRIRLSKACVEKVMWIWNQDVNDTKLTDFLSLIDSYADGNVTYKELEQQKNILWREMDEMSSVVQYEKASIIGLAAVYTANIALYDELLFQNSEESDLDEDLDSFTWDTSYLVSLVYPVTSNDKDQYYTSKKKYWMWYIQYAKDLFLENIDEID